MKKMFMAVAALTIAVATAPSFVDQSFAASAKRKAAAERSPYCDMAKNQRNTPSWNEHYGCLKPAQRQAYAGASAPERAAARGSKSEYCKIAMSQKNAPQWNDYYHCR